MRRGAQLRQEKEYLAALALVPEMADLKGALVRTLRGLADLYVEQGRLDDAAPLFERLAVEVESPTRVFWCDYVRLLFRLADQNLRQKQVAQASLRLEKIRSIALKAPGHPEMASLCRQGYLAVATLFEQAGEWIPAELYFDRAFEIPPSTGEPDALQAVSELVWKAYWRRDLERADHWIARALTLPPHLLRAKAGAVASRVAALLGALGGTAVQDHLPKAADHYFSRAERVLREADPQGGPELADLLVAWAASSGDAAARPRYEEALRLREQSLGAEHPKTRELRAALGLGGGRGFTEGFAPLGEPEAPEPRAIYPAPWKARQATDAELKAAHRKLAKLVHPDQAEGPDEFEARNRMMAEVNEAARAKDASRLARLGVAVRAELKRQGWLRNP
jgi:tetratricopeptide (TPR) repeat protein